LFKDFAITDNVFRSNISFSTSLSAAYTFGNKLKGTDIVPKEKIMIIPAISLKWTKKKFALSAGLDYMKTEYYRNGPLWMRIGCSYSFFFDDVRVPKKNMLGQLNRGFYHAMQVFEFERGGTGAPLKMRQDLEEFVQFCKETKRNGKPLWDDPKVRDSLAEIATQLEVQRLAGWYTTWRFSERKRLGSDACQNPCLCPPPGVRRAADHSDKLSRSIVGGWQLQLDEQRGPLEVQAGRVQREGQLLDASRHLGRLVDPLLVEGPGDPRFYAGNCFDYIHGRA
jgi:hypothetical protein